MADEELSYPIGRFRVPESVTPDMLAQALNELAAVPAQLRAAVAGLTSAQIETPYRDGGWTVRQVVHHVADSHMHAYTRIKFALTEENPTIRPYDEQAWALLPDVAGLPIDTSLGLVDGVHARLVICLRGMPAASLARTFVHPEMGPQRVDLTALRYSWHGRHHVAHITSLRQREGW
jgi:hypothetical protein